MNKDVFPIEHGDFPARHVTFRMGGGGICPKFEVTAIAFLLGFGGVCWVFVGCVPPVFGSK